MVMPQVNKVCGTGSVDICQPDVLVIEPIRMIEPGGILHIDLGTNKAMAQIWIIKNLTILYTCNISQPIT